MVFFSLCQLNAEDLVQMPEAGRAHPAGCWSLAHNRGVPFSCPRARKHEAAGTAPGHRYMSCTDQAGLPELVCQKGADTLSVGISQPAHARELCRAIRQRCWQHQPAARSQHRDRMALLTPYSRHLCSFPPRPIHVVKQSESQIARKVQRWVRGI